MLLRVVVACRVHAAAAVTGLAALLGSVAAPTEASLAKLLEPKKVLISPPRWHSGAAHARWARRQAWTSLGQPLPSGWQQVAE